MSEGFSHDPVMASEVLAGFSPIGPGVIVDATVGGGGHAALLLEAHPDCVLLGLDRDEVAVEAASERLRAFGSRAQIRHARFDSLLAVVHDTFEDTDVVGVLFDLGVSSPQLDRPERGFSYRESGPLDMRMDQREAHSASDLVNGASEPALAQLFIENGETRFGRRIARAIVEHRPIETTTDLAEIVSSAIPAAARRRGHPARRVFQALRIAVNDELGLLGPALDAAIELLAPHGRIAVLSYHSGEDRLTKERFALAETGGCQCPPGLPCVCGAVSRLRVLTRGARLSSKEEIARNPRAESARLRVGERLDVEADEKTLR